MQRYDVINNYMSIVQMRGSQLKPFFPRKGKAWVITPCSITGRISVRKSGTLMMEKEL